MQHDRATIRFLILRFLLGATALGWGICLFGTIVPSTTAFDLLASIGGVDPLPLKSDPMYDYWIRMASGVFGAVGLGYLALAIWPTRFAAILPFAGLFMLFEGVILLAHGLRLGLPPTPFLGDASFCLGGGIAILICQSSARSLGSTARESQPK